MSRRYQMIAVVATGVCLLSGGALAGAAPAEALEVAAETGPLIGRLKLALAFMIVGAIAWLGHRGASREQQAAGKLNPINI